MIAAADLGGHTLTAGLVESGRVLRKKTVPTPPQRTPETVCAALAALFYETVHAVNARDYTPQQLDAWATGEVDLDAWDRSFREHDTGSA